MRLLKERSANPSELETKNFNWFVDKKKQLMKSFQQIAPTIYSWLEIFTKRFQRMRRGWFRLLIVIYVATLAAIFIAAANSEPKTIDQFGIIGGSFFWLYWPTARLWLWIYDGFQKDKKLGGIKLDSSGGNRNN